jgi:hypothetical protein
MSFVFREPNVAFQRRAALIRHDDPPEDDVTGAERAVGEVTPPRPVHRDVEQRCRSRRQARQVPAGLQGERPRSRRQRGAGKENRRRILRQAVEPRRLELDLPVEADDADLREGHACATPPGALGTLDARIVSGRSPG